MLTMTFTFMKQNFWTKLKKPILALAPMAGYTDTAYRQICAKNGADVVYSEMVSVDALAHGSPKTMAMLKYNKIEQPLVIQLFGSKPELFAKAAKIVAETKVAGLDINFGCPAPKIFRTGGGVRLMRDLDLCYKIVAATCAAVKIPVSIKVRTSINFETGKVTALDLIKRISDLPVAAIMVHGRTYEQGFSGEIDVAMIKKIKEIFPGIVLANGGILTPEKAKEVLEQTKADGLGLAQGTLGKPWLFQQIKDYLKKGKYQEPSLAKIKKIAIEHGRANYQDKRSRGILEMRKHLVSYFKGFPGASEMRQKLIKVETLNDIKKALQ